MTEFVPNERLVLESGEDLFTFEVEPFSTGSRATLSEEWERKTIRQILFFPFYLVFWPAIWFITRMSLRGQLKRVRSIVESE